VDAIAERLLELRTQQGSIEVAVKTGRPEPDPCGDSTYQYEIHFPKTPKHMAMRGIDSMQALQQRAVSLLGRSDALRPNRRLPNNSLERTRDE
jgi:hypothetical protein